MSSNPNPNIQFTADDITDRAMAAALAFALQRIAALEAAVNPVITNQEIWPLAVATNPNADPWDL